MKNLFLVDVRDNGEKIYLITRDETNTAYILRVENVKRTLFYIFEESIKSKEGTSGIIGAYLQRIGVPIFEIQMQQRMMCFINPDTREMMNPRVVVQIIFPRANFFNLSQASNLRKLPKVVDHVVGFDFTAIEFMLGYNNLKGWIKFNEKSSNVTEIPTQDVFKGRKQYSLSDVDNVLCEINPQPPVPSLLVFSVYQNNSEPRFSICSSDEKINASGLLADEVNGIIALHNPAVVCVHDLESLSTDLSFRAVAVSGKKNVKRVDQLVIDTFSYAKELKPMKKDYSLDALMAHDEDMKRLLAPSPSSSSSSSSRNYTSYSSDHIRAQSILRLANEMGVVELVFHISARTGQPCSKVPSRLGRVEWMLLNQFIKVCCIPPDKMSGKVASQKSKESYVAGLVLEPKCGIYENPVMLVDFRSLYPSICIEHTVCYNAQGTIIPKLLKDLVETRKSLKQKSETCKKTAIMCVALKLLANATYGCLACPWSRFYSLELAKKITFHGRESLVNTVSLVKNEFKLEVIYGDTDSLLIATSPGTTQEKCDADALSIINKVNFGYEYLELEYEASFDCFILFGKKHYTGLKRDRGGRVTHEIKGLDLIKRGFSPMGARVSRQLVDFMLSHEGRNNEDAVFETVQKLLMTVIQDTRTGITPVSDFVITTELSRNLVDYKDTAGLYHVQAAMKQQTTQEHRPFQKGDFVKFVMKESTNPIPYEKEWQDKFFGDLPFPLDVAWYIRQMVSMLDRLLVVYPSYNITMIQEAVSSVSRYGEKKRNGASLLSRRVQTPMSSSSLLMAQPNVMLHPTAYVKRRSKIILNCTNCENEARYIGVLNLEISALNISKEKPDMHLHLDDEAIQKLLPSNFKQCQTCKTDHDFKDFLETFSEDEKYSLLLNINLKRVVRQFDCLECKQNLFSFFKKNDFFQFFDQFI